MSMFSDPLYFLYILKHLQILEYIEFFDIKLPKNLIFFFKIIDVKILRLIPYHLKEYTTPKDCSLSPILSENEYYCSAYQNLFPFILLIFSIFVGIVTKHCIKRLIRTKVNKI